MRVDLSCDSAYWRRPNSRSAHTIDIVHDMLPKYGSGDGTPLCRGMVLSQPTAVPFPDKKSKKAGKWLKMNAK